MGLIITVSFLSLIINGINYYCKLFIFLLQPISGGWKADLDHAQ